jgi:hypothetical protein
LYGVSGLTAANLAGVDAMTFEDMGLLDKLMSTWRIPTRPEYDAAFEAI